MNLLIVDLKSVLSTGAYQANLGELCNPKTGKYTGGAVYFFNTVSREMRRMYNQYGEYPYLVVCDDMRFLDTGKYHRDMLSEFHLGGSMFKKDRKQQDEDSWEKRDDSQELVYQFIEDHTVLGSVFRVEGYEADDLIAQMILSGKFENTLILSHDSDLDSLLKGRSVMRTRRASTDNSPYYTEADLLREKGLKPSQVQAYNALCGGHNGIPRIKKVGAKVAIGEKTAIKYLQQKVNLVEILNYPCQHPFDEKQLTTGYKLFQLNMQLCKLPLHDNLPVFDHYELDQLPVITTINNYFINTLGIGHDRAFELSQLFNAFNQYWLRQKPEASPSRSDLQNFLGAS